MKIGVLTYYGDLNCGTNLQALATYEAVKKLHAKDQVEVIPFHGFRPRIVPYKSFSLISILKDIIRINKYFSFKKEYLNIKNDVIIGDVKKGLDYIKSLSYDKIYVGADTLLELDRLPKNCDGLTAYWLKDVNAIKILIAASAKNLSVDSLTVLQKKEMNSAIQQFKYIGIRDESTKKLLTNFIDKDKIHYIPDPTFTMEIDYSKIEDYLFRKSIKIPEKSIFLHTYGDDNWAVNLTKKLRELGYYVVAPRPLIGANLCLNDLSPIEQLGIYKYFSLVITHRFHDGVFSLKNKTPFMLYEKGYGFVSSTGDSKFTSLLKDFNLYQTNFIGRGDEFNEFDIVNKIDLSINSFNSKINEIEENLILKNASYMDFLKSTL